MNFDSAAADFTNEKNLRFIGGHPWLNLFVR